MKKIISIEIVSKVDESPDTSFMGEYTEDYDPFHFDRAKGKMLKTLERDKDYEVPPKGLTYRFFKPYAGGEEPGTPRYVIYGKHDLARMEGLCSGDWSFVGIKAVATVQLSGTVVQEITSGGLWGVESDCADYHKDVERDELFELRKELIEAGFSEEEIDAVDVGERL